MNKKIKILTVFGTRPEVIKLAPFIKAVEADKDCISVVCATGQQKELQNEILKLFNIKADYDLKIMREGQDLFYITESILHNIKSVIEKETPDYLVVQGDTTTAFVAALSAFYSKVPVVHIEAGLRTGNIYAPHPEEGNRLLISKIATVHMAPTKRAVDSLASEGITKHVFNVGNTIVDAIQLILNKPVASSTFKNIIALPQKKILITVHRRENFGKSLTAICAAIKELAQQYPDFLFVWPVHPNPNVKHYIQETMSNLSNVYLCDPASYDDLVGLLNASHLIISDSGGIQEEACILGKPIVILREETERPEVIEAGFGVLTGADQKKIVSCVHNFMKSMPIKKAGQTEVYGKPGLSIEIVEHLKILIGKL